MVSECVLSQRLAIKLTNNNQGQGRHWAKSHRSRKDLELFLLAFYGRRQPFKFPVRLRVTRILGKREHLWDESSISRGNWKQIEDSLVSLGWFVDDCRPYIVGYDFTQDDSQREQGPAVLVECFKAGEDFVVRSNRKALKSI